MSTCVLCGKSGLKTHLTHWPADWKPGQGKGKPTGDGQKRYGNVCLDCTDWVNITWRERL